MALYLLSDICLLVDVFQAFRNQSLEVVPSGPGVLCERAATRIERTPKAHRQADPSAHRPDNLLDDPAKHSRRNLPRKRPLRPRKQQVNWLALRPAAADLVHHEGGRNNLYGWAMSQEMLDNDFELVSHDECRNMGQLLNYANCRIALFDTGLFDHRENEEDKKSLILELDLKYPLELHERDDDYPLAPTVITIEPEITGE